MNTAKERLLAQGPVYLERMDTVPALRMLADIHEVAAADAKGLDSGSCAVLAQVLRTLAWRHGHLERSLQA